MTHCPGRAKGLKSPFSTYPTSMSHEVFTSLVIWWAMARQSVNRVSHPKSGLCLCEAILVNHRSGCKNANLQIPGAKAGPQLYDPDVSRSPTTQPEGPTVGSQPRPPLLTPDQPTSLAKACIVWGSRLHVYKKSSRPWQKHPMNHKNI